MKIRDFLAYFSVAILSAVALLVVLTLHGVGVLPLSASSGDVAVAAPPALSDNCEEVGSAGGIVVWFCEPEYGQPFKINSLGFMVLED